MNLDNKIIEIVKRHPGINQKGIITKLTKRKVADKNTIRKCLERLVANEVLVKSKQKNNVTYVVKDMDLTHEELDKIIYYQLDILSESLKRIKDKTSSYRHSVKLDLLSMLQQINLEKRLQDYIEYDKRQRVSCELESRDKLVQLNKLIEDKLKGKSEFKNKIRKTARKIHDKIIISCKDHQDYVSKLHRTKNKKHCKCIKEQIVNVENSINDFWTDFDKIEDHIKFENTDEEILEKIFEQYIN